MLLYPNMTLLDLVGPQAALGIHGRTLLLSPTLDPVITDPGISLSPTTPFAECPPSLDVFFVPGGLGTNDALQNKATVDFIARCAPTAALHHVCMYGLDSPRSGRTSDWLQGSDAGEERVACRNSVSHRLRCLSLQLEPSGKRREVGCDVIPAFYLGLQSHHRFLEIRAHRRA